MRIVNTFDKYFVLSLKNELLSQWFNDFLDADIFGQSRYGKGFYKVCKAQIICFDDGEPKCAVDHGDFEK